MQARFHRTAAFLVMTSLGVLCCVTPSTRCSAAEAPAAKPKEEPASLVPKPATEKSKLPEWEKVVEGAKRLEGLFPLYYNEKEQKLFMEIRKDQYDKELILPIAIARGVGLTYLGGDTLNFGDQWLISFRRVGERLLVIRRNVRVRADTGTPQADAVNVSYTDSVLKGLSIKSERADGQAVLIDLAELFISDLANLGIQPDSTRSTWAKVKAFPKNLEIEVSAVFSMPRMYSFFFFDNDAVPDPRGMQVVIHYGLSMLPVTTYKPRLADDRVGHFLSVVKDFTRDVHETPSTRYVTRWNLEKEKPAAEKSPPKQPIIFWIERTIPREYRQHVRDGILEWNKAFERVGFIDAIQVRDQQADDEFDPEDIRYNTIRWITTSAGFAMGPSRTNPKTGEILDADIVFDEGIIRYFRQEYLQKSGIPAGMSMLLGGMQQGFLKLFAADLPAFEEAAPALDRILTEHREVFNARPGAPASNAQISLGPAPCSHCQMGPGMQQQLHFLSVVLAAQGELTPGGRVPERLIAQAVKEIVMHEVGHTLGLRHNFKASAAMSLKEVNNPEITAKRGNSASIMDYLPVNIAAKGDKQGDYFSPTIGAYDYWAIEYAYKPIVGEERDALAKIGAKAAAPELIYGTDEDAYFNPDPRINLFDLGDPLEYAQDRIRLVRITLDKLQDRVVAKGEGYQRATNAFSALMGELARATVLASGYVGGEYTCRDHRDDPGARPQMKPIEIAKQRAAIRLLQEEILSAKAFQFKPELLRQLAPDHWRDNIAWFFSSGGYRYPVLQRALAIQRIVLSRFLAADTLTSLQEVALHADAGQEVLQMSEVFDALTNSIWSELPAPNATVKKGQTLTLSTLRRNLQREHVARLARLVLGPRRDGMMSLFLMLYGDGGRAAPADARSLGWQHLRRIDDRIADTLSAKRGLAVDPTSRAHLEEVHEQIAKVLKAAMQAGDM
jgi:hypothetical protein